MVYSDCKIYGPYKSSNDGRLRCQIVFPNIKVDKVISEKYTLHQY